MVSSNAEPSAAPIPLGAAALALLLVVLATDTSAQSDERLWTVTCGLPVDDPFFDLLPTPGYTGPWRGEPSGHLKVKTLYRIHDDGYVSTEMWLLSRSIGWWQLKSVRPHPDDVSNLVQRLDEDEDASLSELESLSEFRQIIFSPFLSQPFVTRAGDIAADDEELVTGQILALLPDASQLRCAPQSDG